MSTEEKITLIERQIQILEKELQKRKQEVAVLKGAKDSTVDVTDSVYYMTIEEWCIIKRCKKHKKIIKKSVKFNKKY